MWENNESTEPFLKHSNALLKFNDIKTVMDELKFTANNAAKQIKFYYLNQSKSYSDLFCLKEFHEELEI